MISGLDLLGQNSNRASVEKTGLDLLKPKEVSTTAPVTEEPRSRDNNLDSIRETVIGRMLAQKFYPSLEEAPYNSIFPEPGIRSEPEQTIFGKLSGWWHTPNVSKDKAQNITAMSEVTGLSPSEVLRHYDELSAQMFPGAIPSPRKKIIEGAMDVGIAAGLYSNPLATAAALGTFYGLDELENYIVSTIKNKPYKLNSQDDKVVKIFSELGMPKNLAKTLLYISHCDECRSAEIEHQANLRQPEVSVAMQELQRRGWIKKRDLRRAQKPFSRCLRH